MKQRVARDRSTSVRHCSPRRRSARPLVVIARAFPGVGARVIFAYIEWERGLLGFDSAFSPALTPATPRAFATIPPTRTRNEGWSSSASVRLRQPLTQTPKFSRIAPPVRRSWLWRSTRTVVFHTSGRLARGVTCVVAVPQATRRFIASYSIISATSGTTTPTLARTMHLSVSLPSIARLQHLLAEFDRRPVAFAPSTSSIPNALRVETATLFQNPLSALNSPLTSYCSQTSATLRSPFRPRYWSVLDQAKVKSFEAARGLTIHVVPCATVWSAWPSIVAHRQVNPRTYYLASIIHE